MKVVNPLTSFSWTEPLDIHGVPMMGVKEKQGWSFSRLGWLAAADGRGIDADALGVRQRQSVRPMSKPTLLQARAEYEARSVIAFPRYFIIEPTAFCNKACPFCSIHVVERLDEAGRPRTMMRWLDFMALMEECASYDVYGLSLYQLGEPMLWKGRDDDGGVDCDIRDMVEAAKSIGGFTAVNVSTNGDVPNLRLLLDCPVDDVIISIDGMTSEVYLANRPSTKAHDDLAFARTLDRVERFLREKVELGMSTPWVRLQIINKADTAEQVLPFIRKWIQVPGVDDVFVKQLDAMTPWVGDDAVSREESALKLAAVHAMPCQHLWAIGSMTASGQFNACCHDARSQLTGLMPDGRTAHIQNVSFAEWWRSDFMQSLREEHMDGVVRPPCVTCTERDPWLG